MAGDSHAEIPESGAVFTFGRSRFANNAASHFFIRNDPVVEISCGDEHTAVVCQNGRVFAFGNNSWGQLGLGHKNTATMPSCVKSLKPEKATHVACGKSHTLVSTNSGKVFSFGCNMDHQLGLGDTEERALPAEVQGIPAGVRVLAAGCQHSAALTADGRVFVWGSNADGQLGLGEGVAHADRPQCLDLPHRIAHLGCGYYHTALVTEEGKLLVCGEGENGKLGLSRESGNVFFPTAVNIDVPIRFAACGGNHTIAVTMDGDVFGFGSNLSGQLGLGREVLMYSVPQGVEALLGKHVCAAACGDSHTAFLTVEGHLYVCGDGRHGKLCVETDDVDGAVLCTPHFVSRFNHYRVKQVACGGCHTMVQAVLEPEASKDILDTTAKGDVALSLDKIDSLAAEVPTSQKETISRTLPPLQHSHIMNGNGSNDIKSSKNPEKGQEDETLKEENDPPPADIHVKPKEAPTTVSSVHNGHPGRQGDETESKGSQSVLLDPDSVATSMDNTIKMSDEDVFSKYNLRDAGDLENEIPSCLQDDDAKSSNLSETPTTLRIEEDDEKCETLAAIPEHSCSQDTLPTQKVSEEVDASIKQNETYVKARDGNNLAADETKSASIKKSTTSLETRAEGRISKFFNAFRRKKLSEENVSVNMNPAWTGVDRRISDESNVVNGKKISPSNIRSGQVHSSKACAIL